jgi:Uma2 family endonuclease
MAVMIARVHETVTVPVWVNNLDRFREWSHSEEFPNSSKILYFDGNIFVDDDMERLLHTTIKAAISRSIGNWSEQHLPGLVCIDSMRFMHRTSDLSSEPDIVFITDESLTSGKARVADGDASLEIEGSPDLIVEIISPTSSHKDEQILRKKYWEAGVKEYWIADSRNTPSLSILKRTSKKYVAATNDEKEWQRSDVLEAFCKLVTRQGAAATTRVVLELKPAK